MHAAIMYPVNMHAVRIMYSHFILHTLTWTLISVAYYKQAYNIANMY